jgi:microcystin-dependent protein
MVRFFEELLHYRTHLHRTGEVFFWPTSVTVPLNTIPADGAAVSRTDYAALFSVYGTTVGAGNGTTTFNVPNVTAPSGTVALVQV